MLSKFYKLKQDMYLSTIDLLNFFFNTALNTSRAIISKKKLSQLQSQDGCSAKAEPENESSPAFVVSETTEKTRKEGEINV